MPKKQHKEISVVNVRFPPGIVSILDLLVEKGFYKSRSEAIREILREDIRQRYE